MTSFNNNASQAERKQVLKDTMFNRANSEAGEVQGRWSKPTQVSGSEGAVHMPRIPSGPWSADYAQVPPEAPFGQDISEPPIVGEQWEIEKSLDENFGVQRSLRDGAPPSADSLISAASELAPGAEATHANLTEERACQSPAASGRGSIPQRRVPPTNIRRRLK